MTTAYTALAWRRAVKTDVGNITKLDIQMFHGESWKLIYFEVKRSDVKVLSHKNVAGVGLCTLVSDGFFLLFRCCDRKWFIHKPIKIAHNIINCSVVTLREKYLTNILSNLARGRIAVLSPCGGECIRPHRALGRYIPLR